MSTDSNLQKEIGNYRVLREIDSGAFGRVYLAQHTLLKNRTVAIKLLHTTHLSSMEERESFLREAQFLEVLKHPYILPILDVGIHEGFPYLVAEYAPNGSLRDRIRRYAPRPLPVQETLTILTQVGQALYYAHQQHIIHRDIKPENILFNARGEALLADFGVATTMETASIKFASVIGTPSYMAPEQFQNSVSKESDEYALGCVAYELFTGQRPFPAQDFFAIGFKHMQEAPVPPSQLNPQLPPFVEQAILRAMAKQRTERFPDIKAFITELRVPSTSQGHLPIVSATHPAVQADADSTQHVSQAPTLAAPPPGVSSPQQPTVQRPAAIVNDEKLISTGSREQWAPLPYQGPVTPLPSPALPVAAKLDDSINSTRPLYDEPVAPLLNAPAHMVTTAQDLAQGQQNKSRPGWLIILIAIIAILMLILSGAFGSLLIFFHSALSISGSNKVVPGSTFKLLGSGFVPGIGIALTLDDGTALTYMGRDMAGEAWYSGASNPPAAQISSYNQADVQNPLNAALAANSAGSFAITIWVNTTWAIGTHTLHASASIWRAQTDFTIVPRTAQLVVNTKVLNFGKVGMGVQPTLSIAIGNAGGVRLIWSAKADNAPWLKLQKIAGIIEPGMPQQIINATADTRVLKQGSYATTLFISSNGGDAQVQVKLQVGLHSNGAVLDVNPSSINFGVLLTNQQSMQVITIGNVGDQTLTWNADPGNSNWLSLTNTMGTVNAGALPQSIYAIADSSNLTSGNYTATITIHSNGGTTSLAVSLSVSGPTPPPGVTATFGTTPTPDPTRMPPTPTPDPTKPPPTPTPPGSEVITVPFTSNGVFTSRSYSGTITVNVYGTGQANGIRYSDAFYIYDNGLSTPLPPNHTKCWVMFINNESTDNFTSLPSYTPSHNYTFSMTAPGGPLEFSVCDTQRQDNTGQYIVTITPG